MSRKCFRACGESVISGSKTMRNRHCLFGWRSVKFRSKRISIHCPRRLLARCSLFGTFLSIVSSVSVAQDPATVGQFSSVTTWPYVAAHAHVLPTGKVIWSPQYANGDHPYFWDPSTNTNSATVQTGANVFCAGHAFLPDGQLLVAGGYAGNYKGIANAYRYNPFTNSWTQLPDMNNSRWYPTNTTLPNGDMLVVSGWIDTLQGVDVEAQVWQTATSSWRNLSTAHLALPFYPFMHVAPNGQVFCAGPSQTTRYLDATGTGAWSLVGSSNFDTRNWGSSVMYAEGKVLLMGGSPCAPYKFTPGATTCTTSPTATAEIIDLNNPNPAWIYTGSMVTGGRKLHTATLLEDGTVLVTGGRRGTEDPNTKPTNPAYESELWDPATGTWTQMASLTKIRSYHSIALLLPDGRVLSAGGVFGSNSAEIYSPPYLFKGSRPTITSAPTGITYGQSFFVGTPDAASTSQVTFIALGSVTHGFNMRQHISRPLFSQATGGLNVTAPSNPNNTPPGYYMLFILNSNGVPSVAKIVQINSTISTPPPTPTYPASPTNLRAVAASSSQINLSWTDNSNDETGFKIERSSDGKTYTQISTVNVNVTTYADSGLAASTKYYYRILAYSDGGNSAYSNTAIATTTTPTPTPTPTPTNQPPVVDAGPDQVISLLSTTLDGSAIDDGLPNPPATLIYNWSVVTGPGTVSFADASAPNTTASFSDSGVYTLRLTADDGELTSSGDVVITVNQAPVVNAGPANA